MYYTHFGIEFDEFKTPKHMTKDNFVDKQLEKNKIYNDYAKSEAYKNYDLNMDYFNSLDNNEFEKALADLIKTYAFIKIEDLNDVKGKQGIYLLVLRQYKQIYIGQTISDLKNRIIAHMQKKLSFRDVPFMKYDTLPIDAFKPLDITDIYVTFSKEQNILDEFEMKLINKFPNKFILNKTIGGKAGSNFDLAIRLSVGRIKKDIVAEDKN